MDKMKNVFLDKGHLVTLLFVFKLIFFYYMVRLNNVLVWAVSFLIFYCAFTLLKVKNTKRNQVIFLIVYFIAAFAMFTDMDYFDYYNEYISINQITQAGNLIDMGGNFIQDILSFGMIVFVDIPLVAYIVRKKLIKEDSGTWFHEKKNYIRFTAAFYFVLLAIVLNPLKINALTAVSHTELITYHIQDIGKNVIGKFLYKNEDLASTLNKTDISESTVTRMFDTIAKNSTAPAIEHQADYGGIGQNKNVVMIQMESFQNFLLNRDYNGQEITPNLNALLKKDSMYFDHYYQNIGKGNTSDAEFSSLNGVYPVKQDSSYMLYFDNQYKGLPWLLKEQGYSTNSYHGYIGSFWNRIEAHKYQGFEKYYSLDDMKNTETVSIGLSDKEMFRQTLDIMKQKKKPYFSFIITLTSHYPYELEESAVTLALKDEHKDTLMGKYLQGARYADEALGQFFQELKANNMYDDTVFVLYGDHHGLNCQTEENKENVSQLLGYDYDFDEMMNVPLIFHIPGSGISKTISTVGGQVDLLPTLAHLMKLDLSNNIILGQNLITAKKGFVALSSYVPEGSFIDDNVFYRMGRDGTFESGFAKNIHTREEVPIFDYYDSYEKSIGLLAVSKYLLENDMVIEHNLNHIYKSGKE